MLPLGLHDFGCRTLDDCAVLRREGKSRRLWVLAELREREMERERERERL